MKVGIIGGGISGVSLALKLGILKEQGKEIDITLLEADNRLGGTIDSVHKDGYVIESGTNGFLDSKPFTLEVFEEAGLKDKLVRSNDKARIRYIQRYGEEDLKKHLEENCKKGIVYHYQNKHIGDYDQFDTENEIIEFIKNGRK